MLFGCKKEGNSDAYYNTDEPREHRVSKLGQDKYCMVSPTGGPREVKFTDRKNVQRWFAGAGVGGEWGVI
jgi:hypothetical protein